MCVCVQYIRVGQWNDDYNYYNMVYFYFDTFSKCVFFYRNQWTSIIYKYNGSCFGFFWWFLSIEWMSMALLCLFILHIKIFVTRVKIPPVLFFWIFPILSPFRFIISKQIFFKAHSGSINTKPILSPLRLSKQIF